MTKEQIENTTITLNKMTRNRLILLKDFFKLNNFDEVILRLMKEADIKFNFVSEGFIKPVIKLKKETIKWKK